MRTIKDIAWLAGLVEGEGCLSRTTNTIALQIQMTDLDVMAHAAEIIGCKVLGPYQNNRKRPGVSKPLYSLAVHGNKAAAWMMTLYSMLGSRRRAKAKKLLADWKTWAPHNKDKEFCKRGHPLSGDNLRLAAYGRVCKSCQALHQREFKERQKAKRSTKVDQLNSVIRSEQSN